MRMSAVLGAAMLIAVSVVPSHALASTARIESLTLEVLRQQADAQRQLEAQKVPIGNRVDLYVGVADPSLRLLNLRWSIDEGDEQTLTVDPGNAASLQRPLRLVRIARQSIGAGVRTLVMHVDAEQQAGAGARRVSATLEKSLDRFDGAESWVVHLQPATAEQAAQVVFQRYLAQSPSPGAWFRPPASAARKAGADDVPGLAAGDPALAYARYLSDLSHSEPLAQIRDLLVYEGTVARQSAEYLALLAEAYRAAGLLESAESIANRYTGGGIGAEQIAIVRWRLAEAWRQRGNAAQAERLFRAASKDLPARWTFDWRLDYATFLLEQERNVEARALLQQDRPEIAEQPGRIQEERDRQLAVLYHQFNLAVALLRTGDAQRGLSIFDQIGHLDAGNDELLLALRDKANTRMGWYFLAARQGTTAASALGRVRSEGPFANVALLGMGWAQLAPKGEPLPKRRLRASSVPVLDPVPASAAAANAVDPVTDALRPTGADGLFEMVPVKDPQVALGRALQAWSLLTPRDPQDPAVQESVMAVAYAYDRLGARQSAGQAFNAAIQMLEALRKQTQADRARTTEIARQILATTDDAGLQQVLMQLRLSPDETGGAFQRRMAELHALDDLPRHLAGDAVASGDRRLREIETLIAAQRPAQLAEVQALLGARLRVREQQLQAYLRAAYFSLARIQDPGRYR